MRPHDVEVVESGPGAIPGVVSLIRRHGGSRRIDLEVGARRDRIEIEPPADFNRSTSSRITVRPRRWRLYPAEA
jgi:sulfate transport system ATP-binding protein